MDLHKHLKSKTPGSKRAHIGPRKQCPICAGAVSDLCGRSPASKEHPKTSMGSPRAPKVILTTPKRAQTAAPNDTTSDPEDIKGAQKVHHQSNFPVHDHGHKWPCGHIHHQCDTTLQFTQTFFSTPCLHNIYIYIYIYMWSGLQHHACHWQASKR